MYWLQYHFSDWIRRYGIPGLTVILLLLFILSIFLAPTLQGRLEGNLSSAHTENARGLILAVGGALVGAAAIVFSLVMFAMQVNIERMPHGLFRRLSTDGQLLGAFTGAFLLAIAVTSTSMLMAEARLGISVILAGWGTIFVLVLFIFAYRRALILINPLQQINILRQDTLREFRAWGRRADRAKPILNEHKSQHPQSVFFELSHDMARAAYFQLNPHWIQGAGRAVRHATFFSRRYGEQGDVEVSGFALDAVVAINAAYVKTKGKTFFTNNVFFENPLAREKFISDTLEELRRNAQAAISRRDEEQITQILRTMYGLVCVYLGIDYSQAVESKSHANLGAAYLMNAVKGVVPHGMADVVMEGLRLLGQSAHQFISHGSPNDVARLSEKIREIACTGCAKEEFHPVTLEGMAQLANITFELVRCREGDIRFGVHQVRRDVALVARVFISSVPEEPLGSKHSTYLGPYYSSTNGLRARLTALANGTTDANCDDSFARTIIENFEKWADGLYQGEKDLLLAALKVKSHVTYDVLHWITGVTDILLALSNSAACREHLREKLRDHAAWLISVLSWIPDDQDTVRFIESFQVTEALFEAAQNAYARNCEAVAKRMGDILLSWTLTAGRFETGWAILERGLLGASALVVTQGDEQTTALKVALSEHLLKDSAPKQRIRDRAASELRRCAVTLCSRGNSTFRIETAIDNSDRSKVGPLLLALAEILSPETVD